jgi:hypothetical protein
VEVDDKPIHRSLYPAGNSYLDPLGGFQKHVGSAKAEKPVPLKEIKSEFL